MSRRSLRDELREVFDDLSDPAHPALETRIRDQLESGPPASRTPRLAVAVAAALAVLLAGGLVLIGHHAATPLTAPAGTPTAPAGTPPSAATRSPAPSPTPAPTALPAGFPATPAPETSPAASLPPFACAAQAGGGATMPAPPVGLTAARAAAQPGYDRFVIELDGPVPAYDVRPQSSVAFVQDGSGATVTLAGSAGLVVTLHGAQSHRTFSGQPDQRPSGTAVLREARQVGDFEGVVTWGLGLSQPACFRAFTLDGPARLVVDVQT